MQIRSVKRLWHIKLSDPFIDPEMVLYIILVIFSFRCKQDQHVVVTNFFFTLRPCHNFVNDTLNRTESVILKSDGSKLTSVGVQL